MSSRTFEDNPEVGEAHMPNGTFLVFSPNFWGIRGEWLVEVGKGVIGAGPGRALRSAKRSGQDRLDRPLLGTLYRARVEGAWISLPRTSLCGDAPLSVEGRSVDEGYAPAPLLEAKLLVITLLALCFASGRKGSRHRLPVEASNVAHVLTAGYAGSNGMGHSLAPRHSPPSRRRMSLANRTRSGAHGPSRSSSMA